jgi:dipeptidyl aminopeptidase/acylaminoacyl peptidase
MTFQIRRLLAVMLIGLAGATAVAQQGSAGAQAPAAQAPAVQAPAAQTSAAPRPMTIVELIKVPRLTGAQISPDGRHVLFLRSEADWKANKRISHIWRASSDGGEVTQMTNGAEGENAPRWAPDGKTIAFVAKRQGDEVAQIYVLPTAGGEAARLTSHETAVSNIVWSPDSTALFFLAAEPKTAKEKARDKVKDDVYAFDEDQKSQHIWKVTVATKAEQRVTNGDYSVGSFRLSRDGTRIVHQRAPSALLGDSDRSEIWVMRSDGSEAVQITKNEVSENGAELSPDNRQVLFVANANASFERYYNGKLFVAPASGGATRQLLAPDAPEDVGSATWSKDGRSVYFAGQLGVRSQIYTVPLAGSTATPLTAGDHSLSDWSYDAAGDRHVFHRSEPANPGDVWLLAGTSAPVRVTRVYDYLAREYAIPRQERIEWKGADDVTVEGLLYYPLGYQSGQRYPLIVQTHGGPAAADQFGFGSWSSYVQVLAAKGYAVLKPNYRGSSGYGDRFLRDMVGHYFKNAHLDVMAGVDHVIKMGIADPDRLGKMGWSAGGHMTNKIITFTDRFKAASSGAGAANWVSMYAQSDVRSHRTPWFGGTPWQKEAPIDVYWEHSPLKYAANVKTPTLFLVGERDARVPMPQSVEMYRALKSHGVPTRLYIAPREPHGFQELRHQLFKVNAELEWFEQWITKRPYTWEQAPEEPKPETKEPSTAG